MAKKTNKKKIDWKKVLTLAVIVALIVLKLVYGSENSEDDGVQGGSNATVESSQDIDAGQGSTESTEAPSAPAAQKPTAEPQPTATPEPMVTPKPTATPEPEVQIPDLGFRNEKLLEQHYEKHGIEMGFASAEEYEAAACLVIANPDTLHKIEAEDGDDVYYLESTNEFVVVSKDGYIRTYFLPSAGIDYYNRQ